MQRMPAVFIGHGNSMNVITKNDFTEMLARLGRRLPRSRGIFVISAHFLTNGTYVTCSDAPGMIYDFYGFPTGPYRVSYPAKGSSVIANDVVKAGKDAIECDESWGFDHASWAIVKHKYPEADIPVLELSLDYRYGEPTPLPLEHHYELAERLNGLRDEGILMIGSGNIVHDLRMIDYSGNARPYDLAMEFDISIKEKLHSKEHDVILDYQDLTHGAKRTVSSLDHYLPMVYTIVLQGQGENVEIVHEDIQYGSVSMRSYVIK